MVISARCNSATMVHISKLTQWLDGPYLPSDTVVQQSISHGDTVASYRVTVRWEQTLLDLVVGFNQIEVRGGGWLVGTMDRVGPV